jgi:hypothetical protein
LRESNVATGDLVIYGTDSPDGYVSFICEHGAHAGPGVSEMHTFFIRPAKVTLPLPTNHPVQLYDHLHPLSADVGIVVNDNDAYMACFSDPTLQLIIVIVLPSACRHNTVVLTSARPHHSRIIFPRTDEVIK